MGNPTVKDHGLCVLPEGYIVKHKTRNRLQRMAACRSHRSVRRQGFWNQGRPKLRESLAHLVDLIMRRAVCDASVALRVSFV